MTIRSALVTLIFPLAIGLGLGAPARAQDPGGSPPSDRPRRAPPPVAFEACKGKNADDACEVSFRERKIAGICAAAEDGPLFCRPEHPPGPPPGAPPGRLAEVCDGKKVGDACTITLDGTTHQGTCRSGTSERLLCMP